ncbi:Probable ABC transporter ATP-binding protein HI_0664 [Actinomyces bovis]|uniref:Probable ABC transporter ATP-binding protein HI_0664 n=1 Tax=Actinomyces bovis TaxID=1658 RepID=A0ABY1VNB7_9ACTO|nr:thiol reductant ABC exporter subunit CydC [Actinomyces bovis]SPT53599.1 Probable ABC transporter ATP-binding protein HI_0664 [Actinomyces bovis]VEG55629.1 Probable ABC transporter ATP-binding protein HI_0664 [Actinomyces israelii]
MNQQNHASALNPQPSAEAAAPAVPAAPDAPPPRRELLTWLLRTSRPVLAPLAASTICRIGDLLTGVVLYALGAYAVVATATGVAAGSPTPSPWRVVAVMAGLSLLKAILRYGEHFLGHLVAFKALELLRGEIFRALIPRAPKVMATSRSGDLLTCATKDVDRIEVVFAHTFAPLVSALVVPTTVLAVIGWATSWAVAGVALPFLLAALLMAPLLGWRNALASSRGTTLARAALTSHVTDTIQGMNEVVGYGRTAERLAETAGLDRNIAIALRPATISASLRRGVTALMVLAGPVAMLAVGGPQVATGNVELASLAAAIAAVVRLTECVRGVEEFSSYLNHSFAAAERVYAVVHGPVEVADGNVELRPRDTGDASARPLGPELNWQEITYTYPGSIKPVLRGVSLTAGAGQWTSLVGVSGSGKTTLAQLALRFDDPTTGTICVDGYDLRQLTGDSLRREVQMVPQRAHLFRASITGNLRLAAPGASDAEIQEACRIACIHEDITAMPSGYATAVGEHGRSLSGGQRQRLALARALLAEPSALVLDEFTSHLDPHLEARLRENLRTWAAARGATVVEITHRLQWIESADHVVVLDGGTVVQDGDPAALLAIEGPLQRLALREGLAPGV